MATLKAVVRKQIADGLYPRYVLMRKDSDGRCLVSDEMHHHIAVVAEGSRDRQAGGKGTAEAVEKDTDLLAVVFGEHGVNVATVEVPAPDVAFELNVVYGFRHGKTSFATKLPLYIRG